MVGTEEEGWCREAEVLRVKSVCGRVSGFQAMAGLEVAGQSGRRDCRPAAGSPSREAPRHGQWEQSLRPRAPKPVRRRPVLATTGWESSISAAQSRTSPLRSRTNMQSTQAARSADSTFSRLSKGLDGTVRVSRTIRVTPSAQSGQPAPSVSYVVTTVEKEDELSQGSSLASASFTQPAPKTAWLEQEEHNNTAAERTFVGRAESKNGGAEPSSLLSLLRSRHESARPTGAEQSVSFAPASPETRLQQSTDRVLEESAGEPERDIQRSAVPSAGKVRRQRFGKGLRRPPTALKRARPWVVESATDSRAPVDPSQAVPIERRMLRCGVLLLRWTVRKQRGLARWWFMESLQLQDNEVSETSTQFARARAKQSISASNRSSSQRSARSAEKLAAEGGWAGSRTGAEQALTTRQKATRAESSAFDQAMAAALRRKSVLKWAFVALRSDVTVRLLSRAVASCSCCARDGRRLLRGWMSLHANWLASVESMRVAHAQRNWLCRSQLRRMIRVWQQRAEWCVPRRRKAASHNNICSRARTLNRLALAAAFSRCKRTLMSVSGRLHLLSSRQHFCASLVAVVPLTLVVALQSSGAVWSLSVQHSERGVRGRQSIAPCGTRKPVSRLVDTNALRSRTGLRDLLHLCNGQKLILVGGAHRGFRHRVLPHLPGKYEPDGAPTVVCKPWLPTPSSIGFIAAHGDDNVPWSLGMLLLTPQLINEFGQKRRWLLE